MRIFLIMFLLLSSINIKAQEYPYVGELSIGILTKNEGPPSFTIETFNGILFQKCRIETGIVLDIDHYPQFTIAPLGVGIKYQPIQTKGLTPILGLAIGDGQDWFQRKDENKSYNGGFFIHPTLGVKFKSKRKSAFNLNLGYKIQKATIETNNGNILYPYIVSENYSYKRISFTLGLSF